jgi:hypothetical protein
LATISLCIGNFNPNGVGTKNKPIIFAIRKLTLRLVILSNYLSYLNKNKKELCTILVCWLFKKY